MRFLLDENIPKDVAMALREEGHDAVRVQETNLRGAEDEKIWSCAAEERRIFVTADLDFPLRGATPAGVVLLRGFDRISTATVASLLLGTVRELGDRLIERLVVVAPGRVRVRRL